MKIIQKSYKCIVSALFAVFMSAGCLTSFPVYAGNSTETTIDVSQVGTGTAVEHTHIYQTFYDEHNHWEQCIVCGAQKGKTAHSLHGNGGSKVLFSDYYSNAYRDVCDCGYSSSYQIVILGTHQNYPNGSKSKITYGPLGGTPLSSIKQITKAEFNSLKSSYQALAGANYEWWDYDGDGYGYVFASSLVIGDSSYGTTGTIELIVGSEGDCGRKKVYDEYYSLVAYCRSDSTPTRAKFVTYLKNKINASKNPKDHALYGYDVKYQSRVTDAMFSKLVNIAKHINYHDAHWGCGSMTLTYDSIFTAPGYHFYGNFRAGCYDSNIKKNVGFSTGYAGTCDVCGHVFTGNEEYTNTGWITPDNGNIQSLRNVNGAKYTSSGTKVYGPGKVLLGTAYDHYKNEGGKIYISYTITPASGYTATVANTGWFELRREDSSTARNYYALTTGTFYKNGTAVRTMNLRSYYVLNDNTAPKAYGYKDKNTSNSYWAVKGCGTKDKTSTNAKITVSFSDPDQYSYNQLKVKLFDSDGKTLISQPGGETVMPLTRISGTAGTSGGAGIWRGTLDICTEVNGAKLLYVQAVDSTGNTSELVPIQIQYLDAKGPDLKVTIPDNLNKWSKEKTFVVTATDAFGTVYLGTDNKDLTLISNDVYKNTRTYMIKGNLAGEKNITFYAKDSSGNVSAKTITFSKLDNTEPKLSEVKVSDSFERGEAVGWKISTGASDTASGLAGIALTNTDKEPDQRTYTDKAVFDIPRSGIYYIWAKDNVGNVKKSEAINIYSDLQYNGSKVNGIDKNGVSPDYIIYNGKRFRL